MAHKNKMHFGSVKEIEWKDDSHTRFIRMTVVLVNHDEKIIRWEGWKSESMPSIGMKVCVQWRGFGFCAWPDDAKK